MDCRDSVDQSDDLEEGSIVMLLGHHLSHWSAHLETSEVNSHLPSA